MQCLTSSTCDSKIIGKTNIKATADPTSTRPVMKQDDVRHSKQQLHLLQAPIVSLYLRKALCTLRDSTSRLRSFIQGSVELCTVYFCACANVKNCVESVY